MLYFQPYTIIVILIATMALFLWGRWRYDIVALIALSISIAMGAVPFTQVFNGFCNAAVITVACVMIISQAITRTGLLNQLVAKISFVNQSPTLQITALATITALLSAFMNNVGALGLMMPIAIQSAIQSKRSPSLLLMPIALGSALGGLVTAIGTPPNLLIASYRQQMTGHAFAMFDFSYVGFFTAIVGILFIALIGWRFIPIRRKTPTGAEDLFQIQDYITEIKIPSESPVIDKTVRELEAMIDADFSIIGLIRNKRKRFAISPRYQLLEDDILIIEASTDDLQALLKAGKLELASTDKMSAEVLRSENVTLMEAVVPQGSKLEGRSSRQMRLRSIHQINLLAIARQGRPIKQRLNLVKLKAGDIVLLQGDANSLRGSATSLGFLPLIERDLQVGKQPKAYLPLVIFGLAILLAALQLLPIQVAFAGAILAMVLLNVIPSRSLYDSIDWPIIVLLGAMIPIGNALQSTGGTALISHYFLVLAGHASPVIILCVLLIVTMTLSDFMNNVATTVVMAPIAISIAQALNVSIDPFLMAVALGASCSFLTPVGHQNNTLVMGPGGYQFFDYVRLGLPLEILIVVMGLPLILWAWPL